VDDLRSKLLKDIEQTGFPTELKVSKIFQARGWSVNENTYFIDQDENKGREIDMEVHRNSFTYKPKHICIWSMLSVEIKKSEKPWVVFTSNRKIGDVAGYRLINHTHNINSTQLTAEDISHAHPSMVYKSVGRSGHVAFSGNNSQLFSAVVSATKASIEEHKLAEEHKEAYDNNSLDAVFYTPLVILNGRLFSACLNLKDEIELEEAQHIAYQFNYMSPSYEQRSYLVEIVTLDGLSIYISKQDEWLKSMLKSLSDKCDSLLP
jgi:hypothetical protein